MEMRRVMTLRRFCEHPNNNAKEAGKFGHIVKRRWQVQPKSSVRLPPKLLGAFQHELLGFRPAQARVGDRKTRLQRLPRNQILPARLQVRLQHRPHHTRLFLEVELDDALPYLRLRE